MKIETKEELVEVLRELRLENNSHCLAENRPQVSVIIHVGGNCNGRCCIEGSKTVTGGGEETL